ncbi:unnamed protein product [Candidula unifasciata]|uniref:Uncharacterized protein n=1 Tax=Candidula unifasciata TaxID=100452 RepID=A0A8S3ZYI0_9EUPU|nr:unnamed protein product [Candidula unifasciata]
MGCSSTKQSDLNDLGLSPNSQRRYLLRFATQNSKYVKYTGFPELTQDEKIRLVASARNYFEFIDASKDIHPYTDICNKYPRVFYTYFKNVPLDANWQPNNTEDEEEITLAKADLTRHTAATKLLIKNCMERLASAELEDLEESLRKVGAVHAECWVCSKDILLFEDSFIWSLDKSDPDMDPKLRQLWRRIVKFILHNITIGINNHYDKLCYVLGQEKSRFSFFEPKFPSGVNPKSYGSLKKLNTFIAQR